MLNKLLIKLASRNLIYLSDKNFLRKKYFLKLGKKLNLNKPITFNEKMQWLKLYDRKPEYTNMVDKYEVRKYITETIGKEYLIPIIGVYDKFEQINFDKLPNQFVIKCTHDSGSTIICKDKRNFDVNVAKKKIKSCQKINFYLKGREWPYKNVKHRIIIEKYMKNDDNGELKDYKFMCFNGKVKCSFVCSNRYNDEGMKIDFYDLDWNKMSFQRHYPNSEEQITKPKNYELMIKLAEKLSNNIPFVRVDFYEINGKIYFGELTFFPGSGFEEFTPEKYDEILGQWINLEDIGG